MSDTTKENVLAIAPELKSQIQLATFNMILADVASEVGSIFGDQQEKAQRYLAAHYLTILSQEDPTKADVKSERLRDEQVVYNVSSGKDSTQFDLTTYGKMYKSIRKSAVMAATMITP